MTTHTHVYSSFHQDILQSMTLTLPTNSILSNKSQSFSIVWTDNTDSICDLRSFLTYLDNHPTKPYRTDTTRSPWPSEEVVGIPKVLEPLPPFHPTLLSHNISPSYQCSCSYIRNFGGYSLSSGWPRRLTYKVRFNRFPWRFVRHRVSFWALWLSHC